MHRRLIEARKKERAAHSLMEHDEYWQRGDSYGYEYSGEEDSEAYATSQPVSYEEAFTIGQEALLSSQPVPMLPRDSRYPRSYDSEGYAPDSTDSTEVGMNVYEARSRGTRRQSHSRRPPHSTQNHIAQLKQEKEQILHHSQKMELLKRNYVNQLTKAIRDQQKYSPGSPEFQEVNRIVKHIVQDMHSQIGTPEDVKVREQAEREKVLEIEDQLKAYKQSRLQPLSSPKNSQVSGRDSSSQWSSPPLSHHSDENSLVTDLHHPQSHHSMLMQSQNESGFCDVDSDITASSHHRNKEVHSPNSTEFLTYSSDLSGTASSVLRPYYNMQRSASVEDTSAQDREGPADVLAALVTKTPQLHRSTAKYRTPSLSQDTYSSEFRPNFTHPPNSMSLSQSTHSPRSYPYYRKPGSPASSSDTSSLASSVAHRLGSGPGSVVSFTTDSSTRSNKGLLPRPSALSSSSGSAPSVLSKPGYPSFGEFSQRSRSEYSFPSYGTPGLVTTYDSDNDEEPPAIKPSPKHTRESGALSRRQNVQLRKHHDLHLRDKDSKTLEAWRREGKRMQPNHPRIPEEGSERDSFTMKLEMVLSVLSLVLNKKDQTDADAVRMLLPLSQSPETCSVLRQSACMNMLIQIVHNIDRKGEKSHRDVRIKAAEALRNIIESTDKTRQGRHELCVLGVLEKIRGHCDALFEFIHSIPSTRKIEASEREQLQNACDFLIQPMRKLYKYSNEKDHYRPAVLTLGGLQATAELLVVNFRLMTSQKAGTEKPVCHSTKTIAVAISILVNLTYGDVHNKSALCMFPDLLKALMHHLRLKQETIIASGAQLLRNLSWKATADIKDSLLKCDASIVLIEALRYVKDEQTIQHITSALWNLSAHSMENRDKVCTTETGLKQLVELLSYNSPTGTTAVVENVGGILKNLSVVIMQQEGYRKKFRHSGGLGKLVQHLKSKNKTVLANATGTLWNLSARFPEDQKVLWDLGCVPLLDVLQTAHQRNIAEYARGALRNLLAFGRSNGWTSKSDVTAYNIKTQRELSKSLCYAANQVFNHPSSGKHSNESLHSRRSQPAKNVGSEGPVDQIRSSNEQMTTTGSMRDSVRTLRGCDSKDGGESSGDEYVEMERNRLKFNRVGSVPETVRNNKGNEWSSYMPGPHTPSGKQTISIASQGFPGEEVIDARRKKTSREISRVRDHEGFRSLSQSESYHLSSTSNSDAHSGSAASFCIPQQFTNEPGESAGSLLSYNDFDTNAARRVDVMYSDLEVDDDESDIIDQPITHSTKMKRRTVDVGYEGMHGRKQGGRGMGIELQSSSKIGTSNLALDGLLHGDKGEPKVTSV